MSEKLDFDPATNPTRNLNGTTSVAVVVLFDTEDKAEALRKAQAIPGFTADPTKVGPIDDWSGMSVVGQATLTIEEEGDVLGVFNFKGVLESCSACRAGN
jgi:hypothetical protein